METCRKDFPHIILSRLSGSIKHFQQVFPFTEMIYKNDLMMSNQSIVYYDVLIILNFFN
jgi:hypothetical protein